MKTTNFTREQSCDICGEKAKYLSKHGKFCEVDYGMELMENGPDDPAFPDVINPNDTLIQVIGLATCFSFTP